MSGSTIGGVIGAVVFTVFGGSPQVGWMVGSAIGGYVDPTQVYGPRLSDVRGQTSQVGGAIPRAWGTAPVPGNVIWQQPGVTEHENTDDGKGSGTEQVTYSYTRSYAIMFHLGEIAGVLQIKRNGKIVYDVRDDTTLEEEYTSFGMTTAAALQRITGQRAMNSRFMSRCRIYTGTQTQEPDPTIEAYMGVGNVSAYRGRAYMVVTDDETQAGEIAQFEVIVAVCGTVTNVAPGSSWMLAFADSGSGKIKYSPDGLDWSGAATTADFPGGGAFSPAGTGYMSSSAGQVLALSSATSGVGGSAPSGFMGDDGVWRPVLFEDPGSSGFQSVFTGTHWLVGKHTGGESEVSTDGQNFSSTGYQFQSVALSGGDVLGVYATGASFDLVVCYILDSGGSLVAARPDLHTGYITRRAVVASDNSTVGMAVEEEFGGGGNPDRRVHILSTTDQGESWTEHASPFPDFSGNISHGIRIHYAPTIAQWVVCARDRVAMGSSLSSLALEPTTFPAEITGIGSDASKIIICGESGLLYAWTLADGWESLSGGDGRSIMDVVSLGTPNDAATIPDAPGWQVGQDGEIYGSGYSTITPCSTTTIGEIVADLCELSGLTADEYDVSQLTDTLDGYVVARETDAASVIESLRPIGMFDPAEWDGKFRGIKRGGTAVASINGDDLVERDGDAYERELAQEAELLRKVAVGYLDTAANWATNTQAWERRVGTINARGESVVEVTAVMGADQAATIAKRKGLTAWGEPEKKKYSLPYRLAALTPTDVVNYTHSDGEIYTDRLMQVEDDSGIRYIEAATNCAEAYNATATGVAPKPPTITEAGSLRGPTTAVYMNLPSLRTQDNLPGVTIAAYGLLAGWTGAEILMSADDGVSYQRVARFTTASTMGRLAASCTASSEPISVLMGSGALESITDAQLAARQNAFAITTDGVSELGQFKTATAGGDSEYDLTDTVRGLLGTDAASHVMNDPFVMVSTAQFVPLDIGLAGRTLYFKAVTFGTSQDAAEAVPFVFNPLFTTVVIEAYTDDAGETYTDDADSVYYYEASA